MSGYGRKPYLDEYEVRRLCDRLAAGEAPKQLEADFGIGSGSIRVYARKAGMRPGWIYPRPAPMLPASQRNGGISRDGGQNVAKASPALSDRQQAGTYT